MLLSKEIEREDDEDIYDISVITYNYSNNIFIVVFRSFGIHTDINIGTSMDKNMDMSMYTYKSALSSSSS